MRSGLIFVLAAFSASSVVAQRGGGRGGFGGFGGFGGGGFNNGGGNTPNTLVTVVSAAPAAATNVAPAAATNAAPAAAGGGAATGGTGGSSCPAFGITPGVKATDGTANCVGDNNVDIPCNCPPDQGTFNNALNQFIASGLSFPSGNSAADQLARLQTCIVTLQNFRGGAGSGVGCPIVATNWKELQAQLQAEV